MQGYPMGGAGMGAARGSTGSGCSTMVVVVNILCGVGLLVAAVFMVVTGASSGNLGLMLGGGIGCGVGGLVCLLIGFLFMRGAAKQKRLMTSGVPGQAQILSVQPTNTYVNHQPIAQLELQISTAMHAPYRVRCSQTIPLVMLGRLVPGQSLSVMVNPARPDEFMIMWGAPVGPPAGAVGPAPGYGGMPGGAGAPPGGYGPRPS